MFDLMTATDLTNLAYSRVEDDFNKHPEWNDLLKEFEEALDKNARKLIRLDSMNVNCGPGSSFDLGNYVDLRDPSHVEKDTLELGFAFITLLKLKGYEVTDIEYADSGNEDSRVVRFKINLGGKDGTR